MAWHSRFLLGSIFSILAPPVLLVYLARHLLHLPRILSIILFVVAIPIHGVVSSIISGRRAARQRALLGAYPIPKIRGSLPGNIDVLWKLVQLEPKEYSGDTLRRWANEHGPTYDMNILWGHQIVTTDPTNFKEILSTNFNSFEKGTKLHDMLETFLGDGIFTTDGEIWKHHRALARPFFEHERTSDLNLYEKHADALIKVLHDCYEASEPIEVQGLVARFSMDTITEFLFGASLSTLDQSSTHEEYESFIRAFNTLQHVSMKRIRIGSMWPLFELFGDKTKAATEVVNRFVQPIIQGALDRKGNVMISREEGSLLDYLVQETEDMKAIRDSLVSFLLAGRDTTASLLTFSLYALTLYPKVLHEVRREILETIGAAAAPNANQLKGLKYLKAFLNETLRLFPPVPMNIRRAVTSTALSSPMSNSGPLFMAGGVSVSYLSMLMQRRKDIWGDNAEEFQPERWLEAASDGDPSSLKNLTHVSNPFSFTPFSAGPRICLGQSFALQECSYLLVRLLQRFDQLAFAPDAQPRESLPPQSWSFLEGRQSIERVRIRSSLTLYVDGGLWLRLKQADASS